MHRRDNARIEFYYEENCAVLQKRTIFARIFDILLIPSSVARMRKRERERFIRTRRTKEG